VPAQDGLDRFGLIGDAACGPRHSPPCIAGVSAAARSQGVKAAAGSTRATRQFASASHRRTLPTGAPMPLSPTHGMAATSRQGHVATRSISGLPMDNITKQDRITLKNLKVADFASEETLCFSATVVFDGTPIAEARNDGHGGSTFLQALNGKAALLTQAEAFAKGLPPAPIDLGQEGEDPHYIDMTLDFLVDELADAMHAERKVRSAFNRDIGNKVLFIKDGKLKFLKGIKLKAIADRKAYFASLRARQAQPIVILAELPPEQAFDLWKQHVLGD